MKSLSASPGPGATAVAALLIDGLAIPGQIVADIAIARPPAPQPDGAITLEVEALTVAE